LESRQNSQFELLNDNFRSFSSRVGASERELTRTVNELKVTLSGFINFNTNNSLLAIQRHNGGMKREPSFDDDLVCLDSPPSVSAKTPFSYIQPKAEPFEFSKSNFHCSSEPFTTNQQQSPCLEINRLKAFGFGRSATLANNYNLPLIYSYFNNSTKYKLSSS
jgi:hypothetical protein